jgi:hypothetical protein
MGKMGGRRGKVRENKEGKDEICKVELVSKVDRGRAPCIIYSIRNPATECEDTIWVQVKIHYVNQVAQTRCYME